MRSENSVEWNRGETKWKKEAKVKSQCHRPSTRIAPTCWLCVYRQSLSQNWNGQNRRKKKIKKLEANKKKKINKIYKSGKRMNQYIEENSQRAKLMSWK